MKPDDTPSRAITGKLADALGDDAPSVEQDLAAFFDWMLECGKDPRREKPLKPGSCRNHHARIDQLLRIVLRVSDPADRTRITHDQADLLVKLFDADKIRKQSEDPYSGSSKRKFVDALKKYFEWRSHTKPDEEPWQPQFDFKDGRYEETDKLNFVERAQILRESRHYNALPSPGSVGPERKAEIEAEIAQRLGKPKGEIEPFDWIRADDSNKVGSMVSITLDIGLIPKEVAAARRDWYNEKEGTITIPEEYAAKNRPTEELPISDQSIELLSKWIKQRRLTDTYDGTDRLWLNGEENPYSSSNLCYLLRRLCDEAGIEHADRKIVWYSLRHNLGQSIEEVEDISQASDQLRHSSIEITKEYYAKSSIERRRRTLEKINQTSQRALDDPSYDPYADDNPGGYVKDQPINSDHQTRHPNTSTGTVHADAVIPDTAQGRVNFVKEFFSEPEET